MVSFLKRLAAPLMTLVFAGSADFYDRPNFLYQATTRSHAGRSKRTVAQDQRRAAKARARKRAKKHGQA